MLARVDQPAFDLVKETFERLGRYWALDARASKAGVELVAVVGLPAAIVLHDQRERLLHSFVGRGATPAVLALASSPGDLTGLREPRVDDAIFQGSAVGAAHMTKDGSARG